MNISILREYLLVILLCISIFIAATGGFEGQTLSILLQGISVSVLATVVSIFFLKNINKNQIEDPTIISKTINEALSASNQSHFHRVDRNMDFGEKFWINLLSELDSTVEPVWFVGTGLAWWLRTGVYKEPLRAKIKGRLKNILANQISTSETRRFMTYIFLADSAAVPTWKRFLQEIIDELTTNMTDEGKNQAQTLCWNKIKIQNALSINTIRYSLVLCGDRLVVTNYVNSGRSDDSPTVDIKKGSIVWQLYANDLNLLKETL